MIFLTPAFPKGVRIWCGLYILTWKCASSHNGVHFFDIATLKKGPKLKCFVHFDLEMCFAPQRLAPQRRAILHVSSDHIAPHPPLQRAYFSTLRVNGDFPTFSCTCIFFLRSLSFLSSSHCFSSPLCLFPPLLFRLSTLSEV